METKSRSQSIKYSIKSLPAEERPRERLLKMGASSLSLSELLAVIIESGYPGESVITLSQKIVSDFGNVMELRKMQFEDFMSIKGVGIAKACRILACFEIARRLSGGQILKSKDYNSASDIYNLVKPYLVNREKEHFVVINLDSRRRLIAIDNISIGTVDQSLVHPREVFKSAINRRASSIVLAHNHPSGDPSPSEADLLVTKRLMIVSDTIGIPVLDHIIVCDSGYTSLKDEEYIGKNI